MAPARVSKTNNHSKQCSGDFRVSGETAHGPGTHLANAILGRDVYNPGWSRDLYYNVPFEHGNAEERLGQAIVEKTWDAFCSAIKHDILYSPPSELIFLYIDTMAMHARDVVDGKPAPSLAVVEKVWSTLIELLTFRHRDLDIFYNERVKLRIKFHLDQLVRHNMLVNGPWHKDFGAEVFIDARFFITQVSQSLQPMEDPTTLWQRVKTFAAERRYLTGAYPSNARDVLSIEPGRLTKAEKKISLTLRFAAAENKTKHSHDLRKRRSPDTKRETMDSPQAKRIKKESDN
ncbi:MAG: hypothetical protein Q9183_002401 [Haloplaca sp. 2 TL-2023]